MSVSTADLLKALNTAWDASSLDATFKALWGAEFVATDYEVLHDSEATPGQPFPYCVLESSAPGTVARMSGGIDALREIRDIPLIFNIHASTVTGDSRTAKEIAATLAEEVMKVFGGHPTQAPSGVITLDNGNHLITEYQNDYGIRTGDEEYQWRIDYLFRLDVPVMV